MFKLRSFGALVTLVTLAMLLGSCAGMPPAELGKAPADAPSRSAVQSAPAEHVGKVVRWGGEILSIDNARGYTDVEIYGRPLFDNAEPSPDGGDGVRFIARVQRFLDPVQYKPGKRLTVQGRLQAAVTRPVGEFEYRYPLVAVDAMHLWPVYESPPLPAWYRDPYYDPWWPWGPWGPHRHWPYGW